MASVHSILKPSIARLEARAATLQRELDDVFNPAAYITDKRGEMVRIRDEMIAAISAEDDRFERGVRIGRRAMLAYERRHEDAMRRARKVRA